MNGAVKMDGYCADMAVFYWLEGSRHSRGSRVLSPGEEVEFWLLSELWSSIYVAAGNWPEVIWHLVVLPLVYLFEGFSSSFPR